MSSSKSTETRLRDRIAELVRAVDDKFDELKWQARILVDLRSQVRAIEAERDVLAQRIAAMEKNSPSPLTSQHFGRKKFAVVHESELYDTVYQAIDSAYDHDDCIDKFSVVLCAVVCTVDVSPVFVPTKPRDELLDS